MIVPTRRLTLTGCFHMGRDLLYLFKYFLFLQLYLVILVYLVDPACIFCASSLRIFQSLPVARSFEEGTPARDAINATESRCSYWP